MAGSDNAVRIGCGSGYGGSDPDLAVDMAEQGNVQYLCCDALAERTLANATIRREENSGTGYNSQLESWFEKVLPICRERNIVLIGNFGAANPELAGKRVSEIASSLGYADTNVATIVGDDVRRELPNLDIYDIRSEDTFDLESITDEIVSAHVYLGSQKIVEALEEGADIVIGGRIADASLFMAPLIHEFGWDEHDKDQLAGGAVVGHLLECGAHATGGCIAYPGYVDIPNLHHLGLPLAEVFENGEAIVSKTPNSGGVVSELSMSQQLCWEVHDPANYITPDIVVDMTGVTITQYTSENEVFVKGARGKPKTDFYKLLIGTQPGYLAETMKVWGGIDSRERAEFTIEEIVYPLLDEYQVGDDEFTVDQIGVDAVFGPEYADASTEPSEVMVRVAVKVGDSSAAEQIVRKLNSRLSRGAIGAGGGFGGNTRPYIDLYPALVPKDAVQPKLLLEDAR